MRERYHPQRLRRRRYQPRRLREGQPGRRPLGRALAILLCFNILLSLLPTAVFAAGQYSVSFVNYDLSSIGGAGYQYTNVPEGAKLYTAEELEKAEATVPEETGSTWYLYYPGGGDAGTFGPYAIPDPPEREGYTFRDWAAQGATDDTLYTVLDNTTFVARYISQGQYVVNLYYQFANQSGAVAAETSTVPFGWEESISITLPTTEALSGLNPQIVTDSEDEAVKDAVTRLNYMIKTDGTFSGTLDEAFLSYCRTAGYVAWDDTVKDYQKDENGNVQINIPVTYAVTGEVEFKVKYLQQDAEAPTSYIEVGTVEGSVTGTTRVSLKDMGLVKEY